ncbi:MAG: CoA pyrophosphatase [Vicinamibacterales bacterium]
MSPEFIEELRAALAGPLPGLDAQLRMAPQPRVDWDPASFPEGVRDGAVLLLLYPHLGAPHLALTVRGAELRQHTGQVSLPGGRVDSGESIEAAALRETAEEIGVRPETVRVLGKLTPLEIPVSGFVLRPVVGIVEARPKFVRAEWEVARIIEVALSTLADPTVLKRETRVRVRGGISTQVDTPYFDIDGEKVWGATAMVLAEFMALVGGRGL